MPQILGSYQLLDDPATGAPIILSKGAGGLVYKAYGIRIKCPAALSVIPFSNFPSEPARRQFELDVKNQVYHPNVATVYSLEVLEEKYVYATEICNGEMLDCRVADQGSLPVEMAIHIGMQVAEVFIEICHSKLSLRHVSASKIILVGDDDDLSVKLIDLALFGGADPTQLDFRSPEEREGRPVDEKSAVYSLASLIYYMVVGEVKYRIYRERFAHQNYVLAASTDLPRGLVAILNKALHFGPEGRLASCVDLLDLLRRGTVSDDMDISSEEDSESEETQPDVPTDEIQAKEQRLAELRAQMEREEAAQRDAEAGEQRFAELRAEQDREETARRDAESKEQRLAELRAEQEREEAVRRDAEAEEQRLAELRAEQEREETARRDAEAGEQRLAELKAEQEREEAVRRDAEAKERRLAELRAEQEREEAASNKVEPEERRLVETKAEREREEAARRAAEAEEKLPVEPSLPQEHEESKQKLESEDEAASQPDEDASVGAGWIVALIILVLGCLAGLYFWFGPSTQAVTSGKLTINTDPPGAHVTLDGKTSQTAPCTFSDVAYGTHHLTVELDGYKPYKKDIPFDGSPLAPIKLSQITATSGDWTIDTQPTGARITLDGKTSQTAPGTFPDVAYGTHHLAVELDGYKSLSLDLPFDGSQVAPIKLSKVPVTSADWTINTDPTGAHITLDGKTSKTAPGTFPDVAYGTHHLTVELDGYKSLSFDLPFDGSQVAPIKLSLVSVTSGNLTIDTVPTGAHITLDGKTFQTAPGIFPDVAYGTHHLTVKLDGYKPYAEDIKFDGSPLSSIKLEWIDPLQDLVDHIEAGPHDSPGYLRAALNYLQQVKAQTHSPQLDPDKVLQDVNAALLGLEKKMISLPQYEHKKEVYQPLLDNNVLKDAADIGFVPAMVMLADSVWDVEGSNAEQLFISAANQNDRYAMRMLGKLYLVKADREKATEWFKKARDAGDVYAKVVLLQHTLDDKSADTADKADAVTQLHSYVEAGEKAFQNGDTTIDMPALGRAEFELGTGLAKGNIKPAQSDGSHLDDEARSLLDKATQHGEPLGFLTLGNMELKAGPDHKPRAKDYFQQGANEGSKACSDALDALNKLNP